jgi:hypothetical protein
MLSLVSYTTGAAYSHKRGSKMLEKQRSVILVLSIWTLLAINLPAPATAQMSSTNYRITTTVMSGGGTPMGSTTYQMNGTIGQPSPLIDPADPPQSTSYDLLTGFWYTTGAGHGCLYDYLGDGDVDGADLTEFLNAYSLIEVEGFAMEFGRVDCLQ